jgi:hypothetical protein
VHPDICEDETLANCSAYAERTFVRLWTHLDDDGRCKDDARLLVAQLYPLHVEMTAERVEKDLCELAQVGLLQRYMVNGKRYLMAKPAAWSRYQKPRRRVASKHPPPHPPDNVRDRSDNVRDCTAGEVDGGGEGAGDGVTPNERFTRGLAPNGHPQAVDNKHLRLVERANGIAQGGSA